MAAVHSCRKNSAQRVGAVFQRLELLQWKTSGTSWLVHWVILAVFLQKESFGASVQRIGCPGSQVSSMSRYQGIDITSRSWWWRRCISLYTGYDTMPSWFLLTGVSRHCHSLLQRLSFRERRESQLCPPALMLFRLEYGPGLMNSTKDLTHNKRLGLVCQAACCALDFFLRRWPEMACAWLKVQFWESDHCYLYACISSLLCMRECHWLVRKLHTLLHYKCNSYKILDGLIFLDKILTNVTI